MKQPSFDLAELLERLRQVGLSVDTRQYLAAHEMLLRFAAQGRVFDHDVNALIAHLGPIFCGSPEDQQLFRNEVLAWRRPPSGSEGPLGPESPARRWVGFIAALLVLGMLIAGLGRSYWGWFGTRASPSAQLPPELTEPRPSAGPLVYGPLTIDKPTLVSRGSVEAQPIEVPGIPWPIVVGGAAGLGIAAFCGLWYAHRLRRDSVRDAVLRRREGPEKAKEIGLDPQSRIDIDIPIPMLRRISAGLRRARAQTLVEFNTTATVEATARAGGLFLPAFLPRFATPEYLVLIDRRSRDDHFAHIAHRWLTQLRDQGVAAEIYEFNSDPRVCNEYGTTIPRRLAALLARHHRATLFLFAESDTCIDRTTNRTQPWLDSFNALPNRAVFTLKPAYRWAGRERMLIDSGFVVLPATPAGLLSAAVMESDLRQPLALATKYTREFPRLLIQGNLRWLDRNAPPDDVVRRLLQELHAFLGPEGYTWLCTCAIYPQISWPITLTLLEPALEAGNDIEVQYALHNHLPALSRLPWFRYGFMPGWLRRLLIAHLDDAHERAIRELLRHMVCALLDANTAPPSVKAGDIAKVRTKGSERSERALRVRAVDIAQNVPADSPLHDAVFLDFIAGAAPDPLVLQLASSAHSGGPRRRRVPERILGRWRALTTRTPLLARSAVSAAFSLLATLVLIGLLGETPKAAPTRNSDETNLFETTKLRLNSGMALALARNGGFFVLGQPIGSPAGAVVLDLRSNVSAPLPQMDSDALQVSISLDSQRMAILTAKGSLYVYDTSRRLIGSRLSFATSLAGPHRIALDASGRRLAIAASGSLSVLDAETNDLRSIAAAKLQAAYDLEFNRAGTLLAVAPGNGPVSLWNAEDLAAQGTLGDARAATVAPIEVSFSPDGTYVAVPVFGSVASTRQSRVDIWNVNTRSLSDLSFDLGGQRVWGVQWSAGGDLLTFAGWESARDEHPPQIVQLSSRRWVFDGTQLPAESALFTVRFTQSSNEPGVTRYVVEKMSATFAPPATPAPEPTQKAPVKPPTIRPRSPKQPRIASPAQNNVSVSPANPLVSATKTESTLNGTLSGQPATLPPSNSASVPDSTQQIQYRNEKALASLQSDVQAAARRLLVIAEEQRIQVELTATQDVKSAETNPAFADLHRSGRAFDVAIVDNVSDSDRRGLLEAVGKMGMQAGLRWSGNDLGGDPHHFDLPSLGVSPQPPAAISIDGVTSSSAPSAKSPSQTGSGTLDLEKTRFILPGDAEANGGQRIGPYCCDGYTATIRTRQGAVAGYIHLALGQPQRDPKGTYSDSSLITEVTVTVSAVSGVAALNPGASYSATAARQASFTFYAKSANPNAVQRLQSGMLRFTLSMQNPAATTGKADGLPGFDVKDLAIIVDVQERGAAASN